MKNITRHIGCLELVHRLPQSFNGNARFRIRVDGFTCDTQVDSAYADDCKNLWGRPVIAEIGTHYGTAQLSRIRLARPIDVSHRHELEELALKMCTPEDVYHLRDALPETSDADLRTVVWGS